jgi:endonuclease YncB( thermonuclease family)
MDFSSSDNLSRFQLKGIQTKGKVLSVYDGDTLDIAVLLPLSQLTSCIQCNPSLLNENMIMRMKCRLDHLDAVELKTPNGKDAKEILNAYKGHILTCHLGSFDKYGRLLVSLYDQQLYLNQFFIQTYPHLFVAYDGGKKTL